jgi:hypothetical protein
MSDDRNTDDPDLQRPNVLLAAGVAAIGGLAASPAAAQGATNDRPLGARLQGV